MSEFDEAKLLREAMRLLVRSLGFLDRGEAMCCGVTLSQCHSIVEIGRAGSISLNELANVLGLDKSTVSRTVDALVNEGIIVREADPADRRYLVLSLSTKGRELYTGLEERSAAYYDQVMASLPPEKRSQVVDSLQALVKAIKATGCC